MLVRTDISVARPSMNRAWGRPTLPTTKPRRRKKMMPRIVSTLGVKTPPNQPSSLSDLGPDFIIGLVELRRAK